MEKQFEQSVKDQLAFELKPGQYFVQDSSSEFTTKKEFKFIVNENLVETLVVINGIPYFMYKQGLNKEYYDFQIEMKRLRAATIDQVKLFKDIRKLYGDDLKTYEEEMLEPID